MCYCDVTECWTWDQMVIGWSSSCLLVYDDCGQDVLSSNNTCSAASLLDSPDKPVPECQIVLAFAAARGDGDDN